MEKIKNILYLSAGSHGSPGLIEELRGFRNFKIVGIDIKDKTHAEYLCDTYYKVPRYNNPTYINIVSDIFKKEKIDICMFGHTKETILLQQSGLPCLTSSPYVLEITTDKLKTYMTFPNYVPNYIPIKKGDNVFKKALELGYPDKEICFKPQVSSGGRGFRIIAEENYNKTNDVFYNKETPKMTLEELNSLDFPPLLLMEKLKGKNYHVDILANKGKIVKAVISYRIEEMMGLGYCLETTTKKPKYLDIAKEIVSKLNLSYNCFFQMMGNKLLEVGGRAAGSVPIGQDLVIGAIELYEGSDPILSNTQVTFLRYWKPLFILKENK